MNSITMHKKAATFMKQLLTWLRNGSIVSGEDADTAHYREMCLERAYVIASRDLLPLLGTMGVIQKLEDDVGLGNLADISAMMQKQVITRELQ